MAGPQGAHRRSCAAPTPRPATRSRPAASTVTTTLDLRLQHIAEKWVKAATVVPNAKNPRADGQGARPPVPALDGQPAQQGPPQRRAHRDGLPDRRHRRVRRLGGPERRRKATKKFQPRFDVLADGWRQPGSAFKPVVYSHRHREQEHHGGVDVHGRRDRLRRRLHADRRGQPRARARSACATPSSSRSTSRPSRRAPSSATTRSRQQAEAMGIQFQNGARRRGAAFPLGVEVVHPMRPGPRVRHPRRPGPARGADDDPHGHRQHRQTSSIEREPRPKPVDALDPGAAVHHHRHPRGQHEPAEEPVLGPVRDQRRRRAPARPRSRPAPTTRPATSTPTATSPRPTTRGAQGRRVRAGRRRVERQLRQLARQHAAAEPLFSIDVTDATSGRASSRRRPRAGTSTPSRRPTASRRASVDPWTGLASSSRNAVVELFLPGTAPTAPCPRTRAAARRSWPPPGSRTSTRRGWPPTRAGSPGPDAAPGRPRRPREHRDRVLLQPGCSTRTAGPGARSLGSGAGCGRARARPPSHRPVRLDRRRRRPVGRARRSCPSPSESTAPDRGPDRAPAAHGGAHRAADARADPGADARAHASRSRRRPSSPPRPSRGGRNGGEPERAVSASSQESGL